MANERSRRANAGSKMASLMNSMEEDDFYKDTYGGFAEEENDKEYAYLSPQEDDVVDSDFSIDENDEPKSDPEAEEGPKKAKRALGVQTKAYKEPKRNKDGSIKRPVAKPPQQQPVKNKPRPQIKAVLLTEFGRKYTRASTVNKTAETAKRQKERIAKAKKLLRKKAKMTKKVDRELTQEEKLEEAKLTEKINIESLKKYEQMELENKKKAVRLSKKTVQGPFIRYRSVAMPHIQDKINVEEIVEDEKSESQERTFLTFSDHGSYREAFPLQQRRLTQNRICPITRLPAKYFDPVTQHPYANLQAFRILRETYYNQLEQKGDKNDPEVAAWLEWRQKNKPNKSSLLNPISRPAPQAFANLLLNSAQPVRQAPASAPASATSSPVGKLTAVIRAGQQPAVAAVPSVAAAAVSAARPVIQQQKVHIQAGQPQQSIVLPVRTTPLTSTSAPVSSISVPVTSIAHAANLPTHPAGAIQTVKIGGGQAQVIQFNHFVFTICRHSQFPFGFFRLTWLVFQEPLAQLL